MGNGMPGTVATGDMFLRFDALLNGTHRDAVLREMENKDPIPTTLNGRGGFGANDHSHINDHWLDPVNGWFRGGPSAAQRHEMLRLGYVEAIRTAKRKSEGKPEGIPVKTLWLCPGASGWSVVVVASDAQVNLLIITPHSDEARAVNYTAGHVSTGSPLNVKEEIWEIGLRDAHLNRAITEMERAGGSGSSWTFTSATFDDPAHYEADVVTEGRFRSMTESELEEMDPEAMEIVEVRMRTTG